MIGDIKIWIKTFLQQNITCNHNYEADRIGILTGLFYGRICTKCNKLEK